jgi:hypothetical protein
MQSCRLTAIVLTASPSLRALDFGGFDDRYLPAFDLLPPVLKLSMLGEVGIHDRESGGTDAMILLRGHHERCAQRYVGLQ